MKVSIFTPTHDSKFLVEAYKSIKNQAFDEWLIVYNNGAKEVDFKDSRMKSVKVENGPSYVGRFKKIACEHCTGDILVELDHDDLLMPNAIEEIKKAFTDGIGFVYSNTIHSDMAFNKIKRFSELYGWRYREIKQNGWILDEHISFEPNPNSISRIWFAPNHVRAFRKDIYDKVGGHNQGMRVLDDLDLMCRCYQITGFKHIDKPLYIYRVHGKNSWIVHNAEIQNNVYRIHDKYIEALALRWADLNGLLKVNLGSRINTDDRYISVDLRDVDICTDLNHRWPFADNSIGVLKASDIFEHLNEPLHVMTELYRVLVPGGYALIQVPSTDGRGAFQDPTHKSFWNENSFLYYTDRRWGKYIDNPVRFQAMRLYTTDKNKEGVSWVRAHLIKLVDGMRVPGLITI